MNEDSSNLRFCCFEYSLSKDKTAVTGIDLLIPRPVERDIKVKLSINLAEIRYNFKNVGITIEKQLDALTWHDAQIEVPTTEAPTLDNTVR